MQIKTTHDIIEEQFKTKIEKHILRNIRLTQPIEDIAKYHQKKWVAVDDVLRIIKSLWCIGNTKIEDFSNKKLSIIKEELLEVKQNASQG